MTYRLLQIAQKTASLETSSYVQCGKMSYYSKKPDHPSVVTTDESHRAGSSLSQTTEDPPMKCSDQTYVSRAEQLLVTATKTQRAVHPQNGRLLELTNLTESPSYQVIPLPTTTPKPILRRQISSDMNPPNIARTRTNIPYQQQTIASNSNVLGGSSSRTCRLPMAAVKDLNIVTKEVAQATLKPQQLLCGHLTSLLMHQLKLGLMHRMVSKLLDTPVKSAICKWL
ncbi:hypothetical protein EG68_04297 [Paragonimus skrjabini miyazakii]|uniref:Uncharacterized protein n=1 Tax=Paragonimus skrjabini miyazakii TaxID=59628 RepID=A0A8S9YX92_9TREM|nr:hypothetical protein EG68_04297 [Paragonimus skrjabini miyazakii]